MDRVTIRPIAGLAVPMPGGGMLPAEGLEVERDLYWQRRIADGDVEIVPAVKPAKSKEG